jgi:hypothetical protein
MASPLAISASEDVIDGPFMFDSAPSWHELVLFQPLSQPWIGQNQGDPC